MLPEIGSALRRLLYDYGRIPAREVDIQFDAPTRDWIDGLTRPTINLFLFDLQENTGLRSNARQTTRANGQATIRLPPRRLDLHYMVSALTTDVDDEYRLLWRVLVTLMKHPTLPPEVLAREIESVDVPVPGRVVLPDEAMKPIMIWNALGAPPRPAVTYVVTVPVDLDVAFEAPLVLTRTARYQPIGSALTPERRIQIGGVVRDAAGATLAGVVVAVEGSSVTGVTSADGSFSLSRVNPGRVTLRATGGDGRETAVTVDVPAESYDIVLE